jgi:hypothetical protein
MEGQWRARQAMIEHAVRVPVTHAVTGRERARQAFAQNTAATSRTGRPKR